MLSQGRISKTIRCLMALILCALLAPALNVSASDAPLSSYNLATYQFLPDPDYTQDDEKALIRVSSYDLPRLQFIWLDPQGEEVGCIDGGICSYVNTTTSVTAEFYIAGRGLPSGTYTAHVLYCSLILNNICVLWDFYLDAHFTISGFPISGNAGVAGATLSYFDGTAKTAYADDAGNYTINVPPGWSGTVTPSKPLYIFLPPSMTYSNVQGAYSEQNYTAMEIHYTFLPLMVR